MVFMAGTTASYVYDDKEDTWTEIPDISSAAGFTANRLMYTSYIYIWFHAFIVKNMFE